MTGKKDDQPHYEVGYGKPPAHSKYAKGVCRQPHRTAKGELEPERRFSSASMDSKVRGVTIEWAEDHRQQARGRSCWWNLNLCIKGDPARHKKRIFQVAKQQYDAQDNGSDLEDRLMISRKKIIIS